MSVWRKGRYPSLSSCWTDVLVDTIQVIQEGLQLVWSMKPNDSVVNIDQQRGGVTQSIAIFSVFYENVHNHWKWRQAQQWSILIIWLTQEVQSLPNWDLGIEWDIVETDEDFLLCSAEEAPKYGWTMIDSTFNPTCADEGSVNEYVYVCMCVCGLGSMVSIVTGYGLDSLGIESHWGRDFPRLSRPALGPTQPPVQWVPGLSQGKEWLGRDADPSPPSSAMVKKG